MLSVGAAGVELWPLSSFRLFSQPRTAVHVRWELVAVDAAGAESAVDFAAMGRGFRQSGHHLPELALASEDARARKCAAWLARLPNATELRAYRTVIEKSAPGAPARVIERTERVNCGRSDA